MKCARKGLTFFLIGDGDRKTLQQAQDGRELTFFCHQETGTRYTLQQAQDGGGFKYS